MKGVESRGKILMRKKTDSSRNFLVNLILNCSYHVEFESFAVKMIFLLVLS